jgi:hypothetical protein
MLRRAINAVLSESGTSGSEEKSIEEIEGGQSQPEAGGGQGTSNMPTGGGAPRVRHR